METNHDKAARKSIETGKGFSVVVMDYQDTRKEYVVLTEYTYTEEFEAFDGEVLADFDAMGDQLE